MPHKTFWFYSISESLLNLFNICNFKTTYLCSSGSSKNCFASKKLKSTIIHVIVPHGHSLAEINGTMKGRKMLKQEKEYLYTVVFLNRQFPPVSSKLSLCLQIASVKGMGPLGLIQECTPVQCNKNDGRYQSEWEMLLTVCSTWSINSETLPWFVTLAKAGLEWGLSWIVSMNSFKKLLMKDGYEHRDLCTIVVATV